jgi:hypothetical protein
MHESAWAFPAHNLLLSRSNPETEVLKLEMFIRENSCSTAVVVLSVGHVISIIVVVVVVVVVLVVVVVVVVVVV